jgi:DHA1 family tetracycline resistance protein-like MFS transporter
MTSHKKTLLSALAIAFLDNFGYSLVFILFAPLILNPEYGFFSASVSVGAKNIWLGVLIGVFPLFTFFGAPFWGDVGDRWGRKRALIWTILGTLLGHLLSAFAILLESFSFLLFSRALAGLFAGNVSICLATISDLSHDPKSKAHNFGLLSVCMGIGWILSMVLGGYLSDPSINTHFSPSLPFYVVAAFTFLGYLIVKFFFTETHERKVVHFGWLKSIHEIKAALQTRELCPSLFVLFIWSLGWFPAFQWFSPISLERYQVTQEIVSIRLVVLGICWVVGGIWINSFLVKRFNSYKLSLYSILCTALFLLFASFADTFSLFCLFLWILTFAAPVSLSNLLNLVSSAAAPSIQGKAMGFSQSVQSLAGVFVPFLGGFIADASIALIYPFSALVLFLSMLFCAFMRKHPPR